MSASFVREVSEYGVREASGEMERWGRTRDWLDVMLHRRDDDVSDKCVRAIGAPGVL